MQALIMEAFGLLNFLAAIYYWVQDKNDIMNWLFFLLCSVIMYLNAIRYEKDGQ